MLEDFVSKVYQQLNRYNVCKNSDDNAIMEKSKQAHSSK